MKRSSVGNDDGVSTSTSDTVLEVEAIVEIGNDGR